MKAEEDQDCESAWQLPRDCARKMYPAGVVESQEAWSATVPEVALGARAVDGRAWVS